MDPKIRKDFEKQGYRIAGKHSAIKVCQWCKRAICGKDKCYKSTFYGIQSHRCIQSSISLFNCLHNCQFCWRCLDYTEPNEVKDADEPKTILDELIKHHKEYLQGFKGNKDVKNKLFDEAMQPKHIAISLAGDATLYPRLPEFIDEVKKRKMTAFLVTNGLMPEMLKKILKHQPTQLYITVAAPDKESYLKTCRPSIKDGWERLMKSLKILNKFNRSTIRLTLAKGLNMHNAEGYAEIINEAMPLFVELKAAMPVGYSQYRMAYEAMPSHKEIRQFAEEICKATGLKIIDEKENSRVILLMKKDSEARKLRFL